MRRNIPTAQLLARAPAVALIYLTQAAADWLGRLLRAAGLLRPWRLAPGAWTGGISVVIPERDNVEEIQRCLASLARALDRVHEPSEVIVVASGGPRRDYERLQGEFGFRLAYFATPLDFNDAVLEGLRLARFDWVYLLNSDMEVEPQALAALLPWRSAHVFAVASQILFKDPARRREETGWGACRFNNERIEIFDATPVDDTVVRGSLYAGGGASLFRRQALQPLAEQARCYRPFYWEDVEWGTLAWRMGLEVLFCPESVARHTHRATVNKFYPREEVERIFHRNGCLFQLRNLSRPWKNWALLLHVWRGTAGRTLWELANPRMLLAIARARLRLVRLGFDENILADVCSRQYFVPCRDMNSRPAVVVVSPYALFPPAHGGAIRIHRLLQSLKRRFHVVVLSDEGERYGPESVKYYEGLAALHLCRGRPNTAAPDDRLARIRTHSHCRLRAQLAVTLRSVRPAAVLVEFAELAGLVSLREPGERWILTLHDVLLSQDARSTADQFELKLIREFDAVVACSREDAALLPREGVFVVPNGADFALERYRSSAGFHTVLFAGPFRYPPNLEGVREFLQKVWPAVKAQVPVSEFWILGGEGAAVAGQDPLFRQPGVFLFDAVENVRAFLDRCGLTINPVRNIRGSSIKVLESLAAGRCCLSTRDGARGCAAAIPHHGLVGRGFHGTARMAAAAPCRARAAGGAAAGRNRAV